VRLKNRENPHNNIDLNTLHSYNPEGIGGYGDSLVETKNSTLRLEEMKIVD